MTSEAEPQIEGVVVSAKAVGGKVTVSVISDQDGRYSFPADRLVPGSYELRTIFWVSENHQAKIAKVEPIE